MNKDQSRSAFRIVLYYLVFGISWIAVSDRVLELLSGPTASALQTTRDGSSSLPARCWSISRSGATPERPPNGPGLRESEEKYHSSLKRPMTRLHHRCRHGHHPRYQQKAAIFSPAPRKYHRHAPAGHPSRGTSRQMQGAPRASIKKDGVIAGDLCVFHREGRTIPVEVSARPFTGQQAVPPALLRDISLRKQPRTWRRSASRPHGAPCH